MIKGFFITITKIKGANKVSDWKGSINDNLKDWTFSIGNSLDNVIELQRLQYLSRQARGLDTPRLVSSVDGPMASGKITRFVEVNS